MGTQPRVLPAPPGLEGPRRAAHPIHLLRGGELSLLLRLWLAWEVAPLPTHELSSFTFFHAAVQVQLHFPTQAPGRILSSKTMAGECTRLHRMLQI